MGRQRKSMYVLIALCVLTRAGTAFPAPSVEPGIYWGTFSYIGRIQKANLDGSEITTLVHASIYSFIGIAIDVNSEKMYYTARSNLSKIRRSDLDGTSIETLFETSTASPRGIALDVEAGKMYWTEELHGVILGNIKRANLDGSNVEDVITTGLTYRMPYDIAIDLFSDKIYWTDKKFNSIHRCNPDGTGIEDLITEGISQPTGIALDVEGGKMYWSERFGGIMRANLDGSSMETLVYPEMADIIDIALDLNAAKIYWTDVLNDKIQRANLDGSGLEDVIASGIDSPAGITVVSIPQVPTEVPIDIMPQSCLNPLNVYSHGVLPTAVLSSEEFDVNSIDAVSVRLNGVAPIRHSYEDVAAPVSDGNECECTTTDGPDGYLDLTLKFKTQEIVDTLGDVNDGDVLTLTLEGVLTDDTPIEGSDCVFIRGKHKPFNKADFNKDGIVDMADFAIFSENWLKSSIVY